MTHHPPTGDAPSYRLDESMSDVTQGTQPITRELGVWTADRCALALIEYQEETFEVIRSETRADLVEIHVRLLAKTAEVFDVPIALSTPGVGADFHGPKLPSILSGLDASGPSTACR